MNRKLLSLILALPVALSACTVKLNNQAKSITTLAPNAEIVNKPNYEEHIELSENPVRNGELTENIEYLKQKFKQSINQNVKLDNSQLNTSEKNWFFQPKKDGTPSGEPPEVLELLKKYSGYYLGDTSKKVLYLTFDEGYENGYSSKILDTLKSNDVKAAFFVTSDYIKRNPELIKRMVSEGHLVCNHSDTHPSMAKVALKGKDKFDQEFILTEKAYEEVVGAKMPKFFRPPMGKYSEQSLSYTQNLGYKSIFWSFAYQDWIPEKQPSQESARKLIMERTHNGGIILLHAVSKTNAEIMDSIVKEWKSKGFEFKTLNELP